MSWTWDVGLKSGFVSGLPNYVWFCFQDAKFIIVIKLTSNDTFSELQLFPHKIPVRSKQLLALKKPILTNMKIRCIV